MAAAPASRPWAPPYLERGSDARETARWMMDGGRRGGPPRPAREPGASAPRSGRAVSATRPGVLVNKDAEPGRRGVFLLRLAVRLRRNVTGIVLHFQVR